MFKKAKQDKPAKVVGTSPAKKLERGFFHAFNNKSRVRRVVFVGLLAWLPAYGMGKLNQETPDTERGKDGAAQVETYRGEISRLARDSYTFRTQDNVIALTPENVAAAASFNRSAEELVQRLVLDTNISEQDARMLARQFEREVQEGTLGNTLNLLQKTQKASPFLRDVRTEAANDARTQGSTSALFQAVLTEASNEKERDYWYRFFLTYAVLFGFLQTTANKLLARGAKRDDTLKQEERSEIFDATVRDIRDIMAPKNKGPK